MTLILIMAFEITRDFAR